jgi:tripartite-type tricarboxylate transporter receptor subunit TctC
MQQVWKRRDVIAAMLALPALSLESAAQETWPSKPVVFIVPFGAGGTSDILARLIAEQMQKTFGKPFLVENRTGAGGSTGVAYGARAAADGHTVVFVTVAQTINPFIYDKLPFDLTKDFDPVGNISHIANMLVANPSKVSAKTLPEFIAYLKANPNKLTFGSSGVGSSQHLAGEALGAAVGSKLVHVPYRSSSEITNAVLGGHIDLAFDNTAVIMPQVLAGKVRALGFGDEKRHKALPEVQAINEVVPGFVSTSWSGVVVPHGTPKYIVEKLTAELKRILEMPNIVARVEELGANMAYRDPSDFAKFIESENQKWGGLVRTIGLKVQ